MKKIVLGFILIFFALFISCDENKSTNELILTGKINGLTQGTLYIQKMQDTLLITLDSIVIKKKSDFKITLKIDDPEVYILSLNRGVSNSIDNQLIFFAEPGKINIETSLKSFYADAKITGSKNQEVYEKYLKTRNSITDKQNDLIVEIFKAEQNKDTKLKDSLMAMQLKFDGRKYLNAVNFAITHGNSDVAPYIALSEVYDRPIKYLDTIQNSLTQDIKNNKYGRELKEYIEERKKTE